MKNQVRDKILKAREICQELYYLNDDSLEIVCSLLRDEEIFERCGEELEALKENLEKTYNLL